MAKKNVRETWEEAVDETLDNARDASIGAVGGALLGGAAGAMAGGAAGAFVGEAAKAAGEAMSGVDVEEAEHEADIMDRAKQIYADDADLTPEGARELARKELEE